MRLDPLGRRWLEAEARRPLPASRDLDAGVYSADDFVRYDLTDAVLDYLVDAFDVLEIVAVGHRRLRVDNAVTVESFDIVARADENEPTKVVPILLSIWHREPNIPPDQAPGTACQLLGIPPPRSSLPMSLTTLDAEFSTQQRAELSYVVCARLARVPRCDPAFSWLG